MPLPLHNHPGVLVAALAVIGLLVWGFWPQPVLVDAVAVRRAPLTVTIEEEGRTRVIDRFIIYAPVDGVACRVKLDVGDPVEQGQTLLTITPLEAQVLDPRRRAEAEARVAAARAALESARQRAESAKASAVFHASELKRLRPLLEKQVISQGVFDKAEMESLTAEAALRAANHSLEVATYELEATETALKYSAGTVESEPTVRVPVRSPITGKILKVQRECEGPVRTGEILLEVGDPSYLEVEVDVLSADAVRIQPGSRVLFDRWGGDFPLEGVVRVVEPVGFTRTSALGVDEQRVLIIADFTSLPEQWRRLGDGYRVEARFILWHGDDVLQVPASSLFRHKEGWAVFVIDDKRALRRAVQVGKRTGAAAQILSGVEVGEQVINHPNDDVEDGRKVAPR